jgi:riboflavin transporter FmnP
LRAKGFHLGASAGVPGVLFLSGRDRLILGAILAPVGAVILYLATRTLFSYYPFTKITLTILPLLIGLAFIGLSRIAATRWLRPFKVLTYALGA